MVMPLFAVVAMLGLLAIGSHVAVGMGVVTTGMVLALEGVPITVIAQVAFKSINSYPLMAIPMFVLAGNLMMKGNIAGLMIDLIGSLVRAIRGGLAFTVALTCIFFAAISGSSVGSAAAIGAATVKGLKAEEYPARFSAGLVAVGGTIGLMIPPSLGFILIGSIVGLPVDKLFIAGVLPGLMEGGLLLLAVAYMSRRHGYGKTTARPDWLGFTRRLPKAAAGVLMPVFIIGTIYTGILTPTEVSAFAAAYAALLCLLVYRTVSLGESWEVAKDSLPGPCSLLIFFGIGSIPASMPTALAMGRGIDDIVVSTPS